MRLSNLQSFESFLKSFEPLSPEWIWNEWFLKKKKTSLEFSFEASAVYSSSIEGNSIDLDVFMSLKGDHQNLKFKARERKEISDLIEAYRFARRHVLNQKNVLKVHSILSKSSLPLSWQGTYRNQPMFVYSQQGIEYAPIEPEFVASKMQEIFEDIQKLRKQSLSLSKIFYHASLLHLIFVHIHSFQDGNGRSARLLEKWFLATFLGKVAWQIPSEQYYREHQANYYQAIKMGLNYYSLDYDGCVDFLTLPVKAIRQTIHPQ